MCMHNNRAMKETGNILLSDLIQTKCVYMCTSRCCCVGLATVYRLALISRFSPFVHNAASAIFMYDLTHVGREGGNEANGT